MAFERKFYKKNGKKGERIVQPRYLYPILTGDQLLADPKRKTLLRKIKQYCGLPDDHYEKLYLNLILDFAEFVQILPSVPNGKIGGMLDDALERAGFAVQFCGDDPQKKNNIRFIYAAFCSALLDNVGKILTQQKVFIAAPTGDIISEWNPLNPAHTFMRDLGYFYKILNSIGGWALLNHFTTLFFARQLLPVTGFIWLAQDRLLFQMWLASLMGDEANGGGLAHLLWLVEKRIEELRIKNMELPPIEIEEELLTDTPVEDFIEWTEEKVKNKEIVINKKSEENLDIQILTQQNQIIINKEVLETYFQEKNISQQKQNTFYEEFEKIMGSKEEVTYNFEAKENKNLPLDKKSFFRQTAEQRGVLVNLNVMTFGSAPDLPQSSAKVLQEGFEQKALEEAFNMATMAKGEAPIFTPGN